MSGLKRAQSLVEFALLAPILLVLSIAILDGGMVARDLVILQGAARSGARLAAAGYGTSVSGAAVTQAVMNAAADLPAAATRLSASLAYADSKTVEVTVCYDHALVTPFLRSLWTGGSALMPLQARASFYLPQATPVPATIIPSTPMPTATPSSTATLSPTATATSGATVTPTATNTPTATSTSTATSTATPTSTSTATLTPTPTPAPCDVAIAIPALAKNSGYYYTFTSAGSGTISATWTLPSANNIRIAIYSGNPLAAEPNPASIAPPSGALASANGNVASLTATTGVEPAGTYTVYFYNQGSALPTATTGTVTYVRATCP
jgi:hypothetical protein